MFLMLATGKVGAGLRDCVAEFSLLLRPTEKIQGISWF